LDTFERLFAFVDAPKHSRCPDRFIAWTEA
jgi:hypothetical protein